MYKLFLGNSLYASFVKHVIVYNLCVNSSTLTTFQKITSFHVFLAKSKLGHANMETL